MAHSYSNLLFHLIWSTLGRHQLIFPEMKPRLYGYMRQVASDKEATVIAINGMPDHIHILLSIKPNMNLSDVIRHIKTTSSKWVKATFETNKGFGWQDGYGAFSVGLSTVESVKSYIQNQEEHHAKESFGNEFIRFLNAHNINYDPRFVLE